MSKRFLALFQPPVFPEDKEKTRRARALNALQLNMAIAILVLGSVGILFFFDEKVITTIVLFTGLLVALFAMVLDHRGWVKASGFVMLFSLWSITVALTVLSAGIQSLHIIFFVSGTVVAGIVLGATLEEKDQVTQMSALELRRRGVEVGEISHKQSAKIARGKTRYTSGGRSI